MKTASLLVLVAATALACDYRAPLGDNLSVVALAPANGAGVGAPGAAAPAFRWRASPAASVFHLQVDDSCDAPATCAFPSPEVDETQLTATTHVLPAALAASTAAPVGRRYYWRVRACSASEMCGAWSPVRYVVAGRVAGRLNTDLNGDGYPDLAVAAPSSSAVAERAGQVFVYLGGPAMATSPAVVLSSTKTYDAFGASVAMVGDVNGDGYGDLLVRTDGDQSTIGRTPTPRVLLYYGGPTLHAEPDVTLVGGVVNDENGAAAGIGDIDGDGYDDIAFGGSDSDVNHTSISALRVEIHRGGPTLGGAAHLKMFGQVWEGQIPGRGLGDFFGSSLAGAGDVNGDGYPDVVIGAHQSNETDGNKVRVYFGGPAMDDVADVTLAAGAGNALLYGYSVAIPGDLNGDGYDDIVIGGPDSNGYPGFPLSRALIHFGGSSIHSSPDVTIMSAVPTENFAATVAAAGDVNGDGYDDLAVRTIGAGADHLPVPRTGPRVDLFFGGATIDAVADVTLQGGAPSAWGRGFAATDVDGDTLPDLIIGNWQANNVQVFLGKHGYTTPAITLSVSATDFGNGVAR